ncbi:hypothetical protein A0H81_13816 [Grifola frondosa]|uniref:Uncharacterized protein n=1 Tax=Grifola frondosa TaxID=5627 RepID=A0A1C7LPY2_GRIFR|nr:hypothetical protein A0H81_13816 [Grifola frondosa]
MLACSVASAQPHAPAGPHSAYYFGPLPADSARRDGNELTGPAPRNAPAVFSSPPRSTHVLQSPVPVSIAPAEAARRARLPFSNLHANPFALAPGAASILRSVHKGFAPRPPMPGLRSPHVSLPCNYGSVASSNAGSGEAGTRVPVSASRRERGVPSFGSRHKRVAARTPERNFVHAGQRVRVYPSSKPAIATGMTETMKKLKEIVLKRGAVSQAEYAQVPGLLRRLRHPLRVYYDAKLSGRKPVEFKFCGAEDLSDVGLDLHEMGIYLQLSPVRLRALLRSAPDIHKFLIDEPLDIGKWRLDAQRATDAVNADPESDDEDRMGLIDLEDTSSDDLARYQMVYFVADLLVAFLVIPAVDGTERRRADRAAARLVEYSTMQMWRTALGDSLTDAMRPIYWNQDVMVRFAHAAGLPALFGSERSDGACKKAIETLPSRAWECQTETSLQGVLSALISKIEVDGDDVAATPVYARILHEM